MMAIMMYGMIAVLLALFPGQVLSFINPHPTIFVHNQGLGSSSVAARHSTSSRLRLTSTTENDNGKPSNDPSNDLSDERKESLFQFLLRDLQVEEVPLLAVDADKVETLQAALWTTLAELCDQPKADRACLIFEDLSVEMLRRVVDDFMRLKTKPNEEEEQHRLLKVLPELDRISMSLVGKGVGPAIIVEVKEVDDDDSWNKDVGGMTPVVDKISEPQLSAAMKSFFARMVEKTDARPYQNQGTPTLFKPCWRSDAPHILSAFWNSVCELGVTDEDSLGTSVLMMPGIENNNHERFVAISQLLGQSLYSIHRRDDDNAKDGHVVDFELVHLYPAYDRSKVYPADKPAVGHIPPLDWIRSMLVKNGDTELAAQFSDEDIALSNYQRRSPVAAVAIKRASSIVETNADKLELRSGETVTASGIQSYAENAKSLALEGEAALRDALAKEMAILG